MLSGDGLRWTPRMRDGSVRSDQLHGDYDDADQKGGRC